MIIHDYEKLLTYEQKNRYKAAIRQGYFNDYHGLEWRHTFHGAYLWKYPGRVKVLARLESILGRLPKWEDITDDTMRDIRSELADAYAPNSLRTILAELKALINENRGKVLHFESTDSLKAKKAPVQPVFLTRRELVAIDHYEPKSLLHRYVKRLFMIESLAGARLSDCQHITLENIVEDGDHTFIRYVSQKSKSEVSVPLDKRLRRYVIPVWTNEPKTITAASYIRIIRKICHDCGIDERVKVFTAGQYKTGRKWEFVSSHTGRRSFATNLALSGVSLEQIALMMGHTKGNMPNIDMTQRYIVGKMRLDARVFEYFR